MGRGSVPLPSGYAYPSSHFHIYVCGIAFAFILSIASAGGTRPLAVATLAEMPEAQIHRAYPSACEYAHALPTRARTNSTPF